MRQAPKRLPHFLFVPVDLPAEKMELLENHVS